MLIRHSRTILRNMIQERKSLLPRQPPRHHRRIRDDPRRQHAQNARHRSQRNKHRPPSAERCAGANILEPKTHQPAENLRNAQSAIPEAEAGGLLGARVPLRADEHETRRDGGLEDAEEDAGDDERGVVVGGGGAGGGDAPEEDVQAEPFPGGDFLEDVAWTGC